MKDLFSVQAADYAKYRPLYPPELYSYLKSQTPRHDAAWDCGTGNGQAAVELAKFMGQVYATDISDKQLANAELHERVHYSKGSAEASGLATHSVDLVTVAQAFHWFRHPEFYTEVRRVMRPEGGTLAVWTYAFNDINDAIDSVTRHFYTEVVGPYWEKERELVETGYRGIPVPFEEIKPPAFFLKATWDLDHLVGYFSTWSSTQTYIKKTGHNPLPALRTALEKEWGNPNQPKEIRWRLALRLFKV